MTTLIRCGVCGKKYETKLPGPAAWDQAFSLRVARCW
jgi:hypothetical protein